MQRLADAEVKIRRVGFRRVWGHFSN
jgi:hypothetical protein